MADLTTLLSKFLAELYAGVFGSTTSITKIIVTDAAIATTSTDGVVAQNTTPATVGVPAQWSPRIRLSGTAWKSNATAASQTDDWIIEAVPLTGATVTTSQLSLSSQIDGAGYVLQAMLTSAGTLNLTGGMQVASGNALGASALAHFIFTIDGKAQFTNNATTAGIGLDVTTDGTLKIRNTAYTANTGNLDIGAKITAYNGITTAGYGVPTIVAKARTVAATNVGTASVATYTVGAADGTFQVMANVLVTTSTTHTFSCDVTYTDESNVARTMVLPVAALAGTFVTTGLITNVTGAGPYESPAMTIRAKASTAITVRTSAGGTFTTVVYNIDGTIIQIG